MRNDPIAALIGLAVFFIFVSALIGIGNFFLIIAGILVVVGVLGYLLMPTCPHCARKTSFVHLNRRVDGGPDRRYSYNPIICVKCLKPITKG